MKVCRHCAAERPLEDFYRDRVKADGRASWCKKCTRRRAREWGAENKERRSETGRRWVQNNLVEMDR